MLGRPRKKRIRAIGGGDSSTKVSKVGSQASCSNCKQHGYNKASCKEPVVDLDDVDVVLRGQVRDERASGSREGSGASGSIGGASGSRGGASGSRGRGVVGSKRKLVSSVGTQKRQW
ncbi:hypothetical protein Tco_0086024 [Tanacetum coccineum]